ncbi:hypothetical protein EC556_07935 [Helicobacter pylori]|nr:hypothetical protein EC556_07935 [Helicobacter pylori]
MGLAKWLATKREMKFFFEVNQIVWIFSCFLLSKIAYNPHKPKNRLNDYLKTKKRSKRKYEQKKTHDNSPKTNIRPFSSCVWIFNFQSVKQISFLASKSFKFVFFSKI